MNIGKIIAYILDRKNMLYSVISCTVGLVFLIMGMLLCDKSFWNLLFVWIIPGSGIVILGTYSVSMLDTHPVVLFAPPLMFFLSLYIRFLVTHEYFIFFLLLFESVPFFVFSLHARLCTLQKATRHALHAGILLVGCIVMALVIVLLLERLHVITLPFYRVQTYFLLIMIELPVICQNLSLLFLSNDLPVYEKNPVSAPAANA